MKKKKIKKKKKKKKNLKTALHEQNVKKKPLTV